MSAGSDQNLLFGVLALQMDFIQRDELIAALHSWRSPRRNPSARFSSIAGLSTPLPEQPSTKSCIFTLYHMAAVLKRV